MTDTERVALELFQSGWTGAAVIVAPAASLATVHAAFTARWRTLLSAMSAGIAHADQYDESVPGREAMLSTLQRVTLAAPGAVLTGHVVLFLAEETTLPAGAAPVHRL